MLEDFWPGFVGVVVGALVSLGTLLLTQQHQDRVAKREAVQKANLLKRDAVGNLLKVVSEDIARFRGAIAPVHQQGANLEVAEFLDGFRPIIGTAADLARAVAATVPDKSVRGASQAVYDAWYAYASEMSDTIVNATKRSMSEFVEAASDKAPIAFYTAVEQYLERLDVS